MTEAELRHTISIMQLQVVISELQADNLRYQIQEKQAALTALQEAPPPVQQEEKTMTKPMRRSGSQSGPPPAPTPTPTPRPKPTPKGS
jgi:hypothetical protein